MGSLTNLRFLKETSGILPHFTALGATVSHSAYISSNSRKMHSNLKGTLIDRLHMDRLSIPQNHKEYVTSESVATCYFLRVFFKECD
jgi:hypothetical protein